MHIRACCIIGLVRLIGKPVFAIAYNIDIFRMVSYISKYILWEHKLQLIRDARWFPEVHQMAWEISISKCISLVWTNHHYIFQRLSALAQIYGKLRWQRFSSIFCLNSLVIVCALVGWLVLRLIPKFGFLSSLAVSSTCIRTVSSPFCRFPLSTTHLCFLCYINYSLKNLVSPPTQDLLSSV